MKNKQFELFFDTLYSLAHLIRKHLLSGYEGLEYGGVTKAHFPLLVMLYARGALTMTEAARRLGLSKSHMTIQVDKLVQEDLMERLYDPGDRRLVAVQLTNRGKEFVKRLKDMMKEKAWRIFAALSDEELEKALDAATALKGVMVKVEMESRDMKESGKPPKKKRVARKG